MTFDKIKIECSGCGEVYEESELECCAGCGEDFCESCLDENGYCSDCE
ncbi:MAG: hypothetical protein MRERC_7c011 [Mycoplasmataceae bacterium RC_NB112A]|nr:MAG: hypothetical protein MRERC_10c043 [Mycoplasmataceae bacterium RC_NB112A]KLL01860.1 MAG: hypothetical protein MRERC_7c011 [Mycoplasmataceae bacterium RC_NB112A]